MQQLLKFGKSLLIQRLNKVVKIHTGELAAK